MSSPLLRTSSARRCPYFGTYSSITLLSRTATGFRSVANASAPIRKASTGMAPPPANGSTTSGREPGPPPSTSYPACVRALLVSRNSWTASLSQLEKSAMKSRSARRSSWTSSNRRVIQDNISRRATSMKPVGQFGSAGSGQRAAQMTARHAASGRRAHQM